jgi:hypothetical protein
LLAGETLPQVECNANRQSDGSPLFKEEGPGGISPAMSIQLRACGLTRTLAAIESAAPPISQGSRPLQ